MIFRAPIYYKEFQCIADKCKENCCAAGWEIDIDKETAEYYKKLPGELGNRLRENIDFGESLKLNDKSLTLNNGFPKNIEENPTLNNEFPKNIEENPTLNNEIPKNIEENPTLNNEIPKNIEENSTINNEKNTTNNPHFKLNKCGKCAFLNDQNLCELYIKLGPEKLGYICKEHPRYYEWFNNVKEAGIGLCCEEAARIILSQTQAFETYEAQINEENSDNFDANLYEFLETSRSKIIKYLENGTQPIYEKISNILDFAYNLQDDIKDGRRMEEEIPEEKGKNEEDLKTRQVCNFLTDNEIEKLINLIKCLATLETNNPKWKKILNQATTSFKEYKSNYNKYQNANPERERYLKNLAIYFIWRYFMKATYDEDVLSKVEFMVASIHIIDYLLFVRWYYKGSLDLQDYIEIAKRYSEEIEYNEENLKKLVVFFKK